MPAENTADMGTRNVEDLTGRTFGLLTVVGREKIVDRLHRVDGTCIEFLEKRKYRKDNKSGFRGVFRTANGRYRVSIGFRGRPYLRRVSGSIPAVP